MRNFLFKIAGLRQNYWFSPSVMTLLAVILGFFLPWLDSVLGSDWMQSVPLVRATQVDGARAILTTLATATLGVAGVAFSVTIVAVSFASSNYGPRLIGNFMADRTNQIVLGIFVATFVYCVTVLSTVHSQQAEVAAAQSAFVPQGSVFFALVLTLVAVGALIVYIHHIPESINIMNVTAELGDQLQTAVTAMLDAEDGRSHDPDIPSDLERWTPPPPDDTAVLLRAQKAGFLQRFDMDSLATLATGQDVQITLHRAPGEFLIRDDVILSATPAHDDATDLTQRLRDCITQGSNRTGAQDVLFLSDQLVEVLGRALSPGVNDPNTAMLCLNWLTAGLMAFAPRPRPRDAQPGDPVLYRRVQFEDMLDRSFDQMRQYVASDRTVALHAVLILSKLRSALDCTQMRDACDRQIGRLCASAIEVLGETVARDEIAEAQKVAFRDAARTATPLR